MYPAFCRAAAMTVAPGTDASTLTYTVPRSWLTDPTRVFPVTIDPSVTLNPNAGNTTFADTYVGSSGGTNGTATNLLCGYDGATSSYNRALVAFDLSSIGHAYIHSANFQIYKSYSGGSSPNISVATMNESWSTSSTWSSLGCVANSFPTSFCSAPIASQQVAAGSWLSANATAAAQSWASNSASNYGLVLYQMENSGSQGAAYESKFYSADYGSAYAPQLTVTYDPSPIASPHCDRSVYTPGDTATIFSMVDTYYPSDVTWIELGFNLAKSDGSPYRGVVGWFKSASLVPSSNWHTAATESNGSVFAYYSDTNNPTDYGANTITLAGSACTITSSTGSGSTPGYERPGFRVTFGAAFGAQVDVTPDMRFGMGPAATTAWGSGASLTGDLAHPPVSAGWTAEPGMAFAVISAKVNTLTYSSQASNWFNSTSGLDNNQDQGRGAATLIWPAVTGAYGYHIYANDGSGSYRQVGATLSNGSVLWSSAGTSFYPGDSEIAGLSQPFTSNPFYRAATPSDGVGSTPSTLQATVTPSPAPSPSASPGCGIVVADGASGQYVYEHRRSTDGATTVWNKIGTGNGTTLGQNYGTVGPDISTMGGNCNSAFYLGGYLYDGATTAATSSSATVVGVNTSTGATQNFTFSGGSPLDPATGAAITANSNTLLLASAVDAQGVPHIYSVAYTLSTNGSGNARCDGYRIREYDQTGAFVADHDVPMVSGSSSEWTYGVLADGNFLYLTAMNGSTSTGHLTKISNAAWQITNQWANNYPQTHALDGCYDQVNNRFWMGARQQNLIYEYAGSGNVGLLANGTQLTATNGFDLRDNPNALYGKTAQGSLYARWTAYDFKVVPYSQSNGVSTEFTPPTNPGAYEVAATLDNRHGQSLVPL